MFYTREPLYIIYIGNKIPIFQYNIYILTFDVVSFYRNDCPHFANYILWIINFP